MKTPALLAAALLALHPLITAAAPPPPPAPALGIEQALKLAVDHLAERNLATGHYIGSLTLEDANFTGSERFWYARWIPAIKADNKTEAGLRINMDGSLARIQSGGAIGPGGTSLIGSGAGRNDSPGIRRVGARNIR